MSIDTLYRIMSVGWLVGWSIGWSHCEDNLSKHTKMILIITDPTDWHPHPEATDRHGLAPRGHKLAPRGHGPARTATQRPQTGTD